MAKATTPTRIAVLVAFCFFNELVESIDKDSLALAVGLKHNLIDNLYYS
jgi:hypothetical protein